jgi:hypothetical protein
MVCNHCKHLGVTGSLEARKVSVILVRIEKGLLVVDDSIDKSIKFCFSSS